MFEVEKKFKIPAHFSRVLLEHGFKHVKEIHIKDKYFDSENYELTRNDYWLRRRGSKWQLKFPAVEKEPDSVRIDRYQELEDQNAIFNRLTAVLEAQSSRLLGRTTTNLAEVLDLKCIAEFESFRTKYQCGSYTIDLDRANFGYELGEIEVMCEDKSEIEEATKKIFDMAGKLGKQLE